MICTCDYLEAISLFQHQRLTLKHKPVKLIYTLFTWLRSVH
uniref:Uncharacterized protein n=1 Tax=Anguilla anguilla TaxID=7936 RepID=A0A0E9RX41_ANGAN